jgi:di-heme cytochrome c peroxidase
VCILPSSAIGFTDIHPASIGVGGKKRTRHSPTVINSAYSSLQFWDGRAPSLEEQAKRPIENPVEMATTHAVVVKRLALFKQAWGTEDITIEIVVNSIPSFECTVFEWELSVRSLLLRPRQEGRRLPRRKAGSSCSSTPRKGIAPFVTPSEKDYALLIDNNFHNFSIGADTRGKWLTSDAAI